MSAFVVDRAHIDYLIEAGLRLDPRFKVKWIDPKAPTPKWPGGEAHPARIRAYQEALAARWRQLDDSTASRVGQMLWDENHRSVSYRYSEAQATPRYAFTFRYHPPHVDPVGVLKAIACLSYQSNETPDWEDTEAFAFLDALKDTAIAALPGYEAADWEVHAPGVPA